MKVIVSGVVKGGLTYQEVADLGEGPLKMGVMEGPIAAAMQRIRERYDQDHPFDPFAEGAVVGEGWPALTYSFDSEYE